MSKSPNGPVVASKAGWGGGTHNGRGRWGLGLLLHNTITQAWATHPGSRFHLPMGNGELTSWANTMATVRSPRPLGTKGWGWECQQGHGMVTGVMGINTVIVKWARASWGQGWDTMESQAAVWGKPGGPPVHLSKLGSNK